MGTPFRMIDAPEIKPVPVAVSVNAALPAVTEVGEIAVSVGEPPPALPVMVKGSMPDVVLSDCMTRMFTVPALAICAAVTFAVSWLAEFTVVGSATPSHKIAVPGAKWEPVAVSVNGALPAETVDGVIDDSVGTTTPLNPPHPDQNREKTESNRNRRVSGRLIGGVKPFLQ